MTVLLQISDPHFGTERPVVVAALQELAARQQPELLVVSGDITQRAQAAQFRAAGAFIHGLALPTVVVPGNHDIPLYNIAARLLAPYRGYRATFGSLLEPEHDSADLLVVGLNTTRWWRHKNGQVSTAQIERVEQRLQRARAGQLRIVVVHQPVAVTRRGEVHNLLRGHAVALRRWAAAGCDFVMGGHIHLPYVLPLPDLPRPMWAVQAGTALSSRTREGQPNSVNVLRWGRDAPDGRCQIERWDCLLHGGGADAAFVRAAVTEVAPGVIAP
ncbi:MAG: metallophosphoesterase [Pseudomonadota bacterium]|nr:metallophosphoesterase [Pseudomonadota bacterium]